ncbi:hypothetical protein [Taibaiella soli]|uniref:Lipocalin-like domain-containing protein n=1 Tax=Taibaiella soli TaxID=1649169 RepID=A0A2W2ALC6_9BACT|nr:hypothetical protein [Taibaiella soli]PZF74382.1 hypothetical protein DN068_02040 [Taibaiella soli]
MKKLTYFGLFLLPVFGSCNKDKAANATANTTASTLTTGSSTGATNGSTSGSTTQTGGWKITQFTQGGVDQTSQFSGYTFVFKTTGLVVVTNGTTTVNGAWRTETDDRQAKMDIDFDHTNLFEALDDDWTINQNNATTIQLQDVENGVTDFLTFTKI